MVDKDGSGGLGVGLHSSLVKIPLSQNPDNVEATARRRAEVPYKTQKSHGTRTVTATEIFYSAYSPLFHIT